MNSRDFYSNRLICEIPTLEPCVGFQWYEIPAAQFTGIPDWMDNDPEVKLLVTSFSRVAHETKADMERALQKRARYIGFEYSDLESSRWIVGSARNNSVVSVCMRHLENAPTSSEQILEALSSIHRTNADCIKVALPATTSLHISYCLDAIPRAIAEFDVPVSITPMGTRWGRIAAASAGSALIFAPFKETSDRHSAKDMLDILASVESNASRVLSRSQSD